MQGGAVRVILAALVVLAAATPVGAQPAAAPAPARATPAQLTLAELDEILAAKRALWKMELVLGNHIERIPAGKVAVAKQVLSKILAARNDFVVRLESYLDSGANSPSVTPEAMALLADLYLDQWTTVDRYRMFTDDDDGDFASALEQHFVMGQQPAVEVWERLITRFPGFPRNVDILDELAQTYLDLGRNADAKRVLQKLLCSNRARELAAVDAVQRQADDDIGARVYANSVTIESYRGCTAAARDRAMIADAWMRLGRLHRGSYGEAGLALSAYEQVIMDPDSELYFGALQELAATYTESGMLLEAIPVLDDLILYLEEQEDDAGLDDLRRESIQRIGQILAQLWRDSAVPDPDGSVKLAKIYYHRQRNQQPHVREVFVALGGALRDFGAFDQAIPVWRYALASWARHPRAPDLHDHVVELLVEKGDLRAADDERVRLLRSFARKSAWYLANGKNRPAIARAEGLSEDALYELANSRFRQAALAARERPKGGKLASASVALLADVIALQSQFIADYSHSQRLYNVSYRLAQTLAFAGRHREAARGFAAVREQEGVIGRYYEPATREMVQAYEEAVAAAARAGELVVPPMPDKKALGAGQVAAELPPLYAELQSAYDQGAELDNPANAARMALAAAHIDLRHLRLEEAEDRLRSVVVNHCQTGAAQQARKLLVAIYDGRGADSVKSAATKLLGQACGDSKPLQAVRHARIGKDQKEGDRLMAAGRPEAAGRKYLAAHQLSSNKHRLHDDTLLAAARAFAAAGRGGIAASLLDGFSARAELRKSELYAEALELSAEVHARAFDYERAVDAYLRLVALAEQRGYRARAGFDVQGAALEALWSAAELREMDRVYYDRGANDAGAATLFKRYAATQKRDKDALSRAYLRAAVIYKQAGDVAELVATFNEWRQRHGKFANASHYEIHFNHNIAAALTVAGDRRRAAHAYAAVVTAFDRTRDPGATEAEFAGEARFWLAEDYYQQKLRPYQFAWPDDLASDGDAAFAALGTVTDHAVAEFRDVLRFKSSWSIAASARMGDVWLDTADKVINSPPPALLLEDQKNTGSSAGLDAFVDVVRNAIQPVYDHATQSWLEAVELSRIEKVSNRWSRLAQQRLNRLDSGKYPVLRDEIVDREVSP